MGRFRNITFLSDYGLADEFVGVVHSVIKSLAPAVQIIDLNHNIAAHDVRAGGLALARSVAYMAPGIVLAVVDPGVGSQRRPVVIELADGQAYMVGPDNGLLAPAVAMAGGASKAAILDNPEYHLETTSNTFDGRDIFGPVAAHICNGVEIEQLGTSIDPAQLLPGLLPVNEINQDGSMTCEILWVDGFGNAQLNVDPDELSDWPAVIKIEGGRRDRNASRVKTFSEIPTGELGLLVDSAGLIALAANRGSAAAELQLSEGDTLTLRASQAQARTVSPVTISSKPTTSAPIEPQT